MQTGVIIMSEKKKGAELFEELMKKSSKEKEKRVDVEKIDQELFTKKKGELVLALLEKKAKNTMIDYFERKRMNQISLKEIPYFMHLVVKKLPQSVVNQYLNIGWDIDLKICKEKGRETYRYKFTKIRHGVGIYTEDVFDEKYECECEES